MRPPILIPDLPEHVDDPEGWRLAGEVFQELSNACDAKASVERIKARGGTPSAALKAAFEASVAAARSKAGLLNARDPSPPAPTQVDLDPVRDDEEGADDDDPEHVKHWLRELRIDRAEVAP